MSLFPGEYNFKVKQGATFRKVLTWTIGGVVVNLTGKTAALRIKSSYASSTILLNLTTENSGISLGGSNGQITFVITDEQSAELPEGKLVYDLYIIDSEVTPLLTGVITVKAGA